jgi:hypothetical protein
MGGLVLAVWLAPQWGPPAGEWLASQASLPAIAGKVVGVMGVGLIVILAAGLIGRRLRRSARGGAWALPDRAFGGLLGAAEGGLAFAALCWGLALVEDPLRVMNERAAEAARPAHPAAVWMVDKLDSLNRTLGADPVGQWVREVNPLPEMPAMQTAQQAIGALAEPAAFEALMNSPQMREIAALPSVVRHVEAIRGNPELRAAVEQRDFFTLFKSPQWAAMLSDAELYEAVTSRADGVRSALQDLQAARRTRKPPTSRGAPPVSFSSGR